MLQRAARFSLGRTVLGPTGGQDGALIFTMALDRRGPAAIPPEVAYDRGAAVAELVTPIESESFLEVGVIGRRVCVGAPVAFDHEAVKDSGPGLAENPFAFSEDIFVSGAVGTTGDKAPDIGLEGLVVLAEFGSDTSDTSIKGSEVAPSPHPGKAVLGIAEPSCAKGDSPDKQSQSHV